MFYFPCYRTADMYHVDVSQKILCKDASYGFLNSSFDLFPRSRKGFPRTFPRNKPIMVPLPV